MTISMGVATALNDALKRGTDMLLSGKKLWSLDMEMSEKDLR